MTHPPFFSNANFGVRASDSQLAVFLREAPFSGCVPEDCPFLSVFFFTFWKISLLWLNGSVLLSY